MNFFKNIKNVRKNWNIVKSSPYASLKFKYKTTKITIILFSLFMLWEIYSIILSIHGGYMGTITKIFTLFIGLLIIFKSWQTLAPIKRALEPYEKNPQHINHKVIDVKSEIDSILNRFDKDGKLIKNIERRKI